jgi:hypothetical protein
MPENWRGELDGGVAWVALEIRLVISMGIRVLGRVCSFQSGEWLTVIAKQ